MSHTTIRDLLDPSLEGPTPTTADSGTAEQARVALQDAGASLAMRAHVIECLARELRSDGRLPADIRLALQGLNGESNLHWALVGAAAAEAPPMFATDLMASTAAIEASIDATRMAAGGVAELSAALLDHRAAIGEIASGRPSIDTWTVYTPASPFVVPIGGDPDELTPADFMRLWAQLEKTKRRIGREGDSLDRNPLIAELDLYQALLDLLKDPSSVPDRIWGDLRAFAACDDGPLRAGIQTGEDYVNSLLRVLHALSAVLKGYLSDAIDDATKDVMKQTKGIRHAVLWAFLKLLKMQIPTIRREIDTGNFQAAIMALKELKEAQFLGALRAVLGGVLDMLRSAVDDAKAAGVRFAVKTALKGLCGSSAGAAAILMMLDDVVQFAAAVKGLVKREDLVCLYNRAMTALLQRASASPDIGCIQRSGLGSGELSWTGGPRCPMYVRVVERCFCPEVPPCGVWRDALVSTQTGGGNPTLDPIEVTSDASVAGRVTLTFEPRAAPGCTGPCYAIVRVWTDEPPLINNHFGGVICG